ncbi:MAG: DUF2892 domain-containing protein [Epsilonproteobacteria bacterium]|nr:DUF2892 domain-containing protein [Campylobacterota bacterium]OIO15477.1 MAG: hypothetical protein AUJ81_07015 [Helicobacteraceae bacterium CG1_02_36_14]PIP10608.1 MAG: hypothetical protein COX50_04660 [Sulfurimonas sp. CG23_combo_of_CG06-09_8_20_14_all_36_33]PIS25581.1 MAG: DUF2892 domain-containing protein [Sulfurimonas sp. CG08_land_8_20_14_0_20_36_33]PIU34887.1 MAG: DUF2892 domain-containing protein [Sulfurimonas sp. CG07_land_8_20_14_0_80_36_56]PIV04601.1 MAG: DUF2892 domain-containing
MACNVGTIDRVLRASAGIALVVWAVMSGNILGYIGVVFILTALFSFCPLYPLLGINTGCKIEDKKEDEA